jgi:hypothetical protein
MFRSLIRDLLLVYLLFLIVKLWIAKERVGLGVVSLVVIIFGFSVWFLLEKLEIL